MLEAWTELGVPGLLLVVGFLVAAIVYCARLWGRTSGATKLDVALVTALVAASIPNALVSGDLPANHFLWVAVGLAIGISQRAPSAAAEPLLARMRGRIGRLPTARESALPTARRSSPAIFAAARRKRAGAC